MVSAGDFHDRRAPYAPISALQQFLERIRDRSVPDQVDPPFLQRINVASNNEYALISALKFLGILDERGRPTHAYRRLQSSDAVDDTVRHLVLTAYAALFDAQPEGWSDRELVNYFRTHSSPSQAKNAARFFRAVCRLAGIDPLHAHSNAVESLPPADAEFDTRPVAPPAPQSHSNVIAGDDRWRARAALLEKLPAPRPDWTADQYEAICRHFVALVQSLGPSA